MENPNAKIEVESQNIKSSTNSETENEANNSVTSKKVKKVSIESIESSAHQNGTTDAESHPAQNVKKKRRPSKRPSLASLAPKPLAKYLTREVVPSADNYRSRKSFNLGSANKAAERPSIDELLESNNNVEKAAKNDDNSADPEAGEDQSSADEKAGKVIKFGWFDGVYMRCLLNIWGVMLFLRLTWVIGQAGLIEGLCVITLSNVVTVITTISMSAVSTNGQIKAGGIYYMISRSLGPEFGGAIGIMFTLANSIAVSMYIIGFCESLADMLHQYIPGFEGIVSVARINDIRLIGSISLVLILGLAIVGMDWVTRVQMILLFLLIISQLDFIIGSFLPPTVDELAKGFVGYDLDVLKSNLFSEYKPDPVTGTSENFFSVFAVFFPAVTGIVAGANLSGDLKDPGTAIPKGTLLAIATTYVTYIVYGCITAATSLRSASGVPEETEFGTALFNETQKLIESDLSNVTHAFDDCSDRACDYGILNSQQMMEVISAWGPLIYAGCFAATLSSAIASLVGAPRVLQAVAKDELFPGIKSFGEGWGANNDPVRGYILVFIISLICILIGDLNYVSSLLSNFFVAAYALINFSVFHADITNSPGWRPSFHYYNKWVALFGTIICIVVMFLMDYKTALATFIIIVLLFSFIKLRKPQANWGSSSQSQSFIMALKSVQALSTVEDHVKNYRPKILIACGNPGDRPCLVDFANLLTKRLSLLSSIQIVGEKEDFKRIASLKSQADEWLQNNHIKCFHSITRNESFSQGIRSAVELSGLGKLSPNMMFIGFKSDWKNNLYETDQFIKSIQTAFNSHLAVGILRVQGGLDISNIFAEASRPNPFLRRRTTSEMSDVSLEDLGYDNKGLNATPEVAKRKLETQSSILDKIKNKNSKQNGSHSSLVFMDKDGNKLDNAQIERLTQFRDKKIKDGHIDVYWLFDDGGLTLLIPHILATRSKFAKCKLRIFFLADPDVDEKAETEQRKQMLKKFRIEYEDVILLTDATKKPKTKTDIEFKELIKEQQKAPAPKMATPGTPQTPGAARPIRSGSFNSVSSEARDSFGNFLVSDTDLENNSAMTEMNLRLAEILKANSRDADLVIMTLPIPVMAGTFNSALYTAWLDFMSRQMPPFLFIRGNQESVLTFYS